MEQRLLRLGDIVDDYCPRERRVANHAIVAVVGNVIRRTRCSTCDYEHEYKEAKLPKKRGKGEPGEFDAAGGVLVVPKPATNGAPASPDPIDTNAVAAAPIANQASTTSSSDAAPQTPTTDNAGTESTEQDEPQPSHDAWIGHRPLIRASLPRTGDDPPPPRAIPEFTMHQRPGRGFTGRGFRPHGFHQNGGHQFRGGNGQSNGNGNEPDGNRAPQPGNPGGGAGRRRRRRRRPRN